MNKVSLDQVFDDADVAEAARLERAQNAGRRFMARDQEAAIMQVPRAFDQRLTSA